MMEAEEHHDVPMEGEQQEEDGRTVRWREEDEKESRQ